MKSKQQLYRTNSLLEKYYYCYMISLYQLIHNYDCEWGFYSINEKKFLNGTNLNYEEFARNKYLETYKNEKIGLAKDILTKGMYFPYFVYGNKSEQRDKNTIRLALGKHRLYSKLLYQQKYGIINKKFLFIFIPDILPKRTPPIFNYYFYLFAGNASLMTDTIFSGENTDLMTYFDLAGGRLSDLLINDTIPTNPILNNEELFKQFIESPLDENNIMFKYYNELKEAE